MTRHEKYTHFLEYALAQEYDASEQGYGTATHNANIGLITSTHVQSRYIARLLSSVTEALEMKQMRASYNQSMVQLTMALLSRISCMRISKAFFYSQPIYPAKIF